MGYKYFRLFLVLRMILLSGTAFLFVYLISNTSLYATTALAGAAAVIQLWSLMKYVDKTNRDLSRFLNSIRYADFSQSFSGMQKGSSFKELNDAFASVVAEFLRARAEKEEQYRYLQTVIQHIGLSVMSFDAAGEVDLINNAAKRLLHVSHLKNIQSLESFSPDLVRTLLVTPRQEKTLVKIDDLGETLTLAVYATEFAMRNKSYVLVSMQNIESDLAEQEMEAWQKLIRVLTHEIMNSVTPIASLASTAKELIAKSPDVATGDMAQDSADEDIREAVTTIERRSQGLLHFIDAYRSLTRIPKPNFEIFPVSELFGRVTNLMKDQIETAGITLTVSVDPKSLEVTADPELIEQVLINLILNAIQALQGTPDGKIELTSRLDPRGRVTINVFDNGPGIDEDVRDRIFTPFFTTKKDGSGIGLSLSRQIMRLHKGNITVQSSPDEQNRFTLRF